METHPWLAPSKPTKRISVASDLESVNAGPLAKSWSLVCWSVREM